VSRPNPSLSTQGRRSQRNLEIRRRMIATSWRDRGRGSRKGRLLALPVHSISFLGARLSISSRCRSAVVRSNFGSGTVLGGAVVVVVAGTGFGADGWGVAFLSLMISSRCLGGVWCSTRSILRHSVSNLGTLVGTLAGVVDAGIGLGASAFGLAMSASPCWLGLRSRPSGRAEAAVSCRGSVSEGPRSAQLMALVAPEGGSPL
jgi:hypothetical protein